MVFALALCLLSMSRDFGLVGQWAHAPWVNWLMFVLAAPVQFYVGWDYYLGGWKSLRNGSANMDVLVAMGSTVAYLYSVAVMLSQTFGVPVWGEDVYFETSATIGSDHSLPVVTCLPLTKTVLGAWACAA